MSQLVTIVKRAVLLESLVAVERLPPVKIAKIHHA